MKLLNKIFSTTNKYTKTKKYKVINILGIKIKFSCKYEPPQEETIDPIEYLKKYLYAANNELDIVVEDKYDMPIWQLWLQGEENMPDIVKVCTDSVKKYNKNVILLTNENLKEYIDIPDYILDKYKKGIITHTHFSDIIRTTLLYKYGGTWVDATIYMTDKIPDIILESDFYVFKDLASYVLKEDTSLFQFQICCAKANNGPFTNSVSFIHSKNNNIILKGLLALMYEYWKHENSMVDYLLISYLLTLHLFNNKQAKQQFINIPNYLSVAEYGALQKWLYLPFDSKVFEDIKSFTSIHKLTYKHQERNIYSDSLFNKLVESRTAVERERERERESKNSSSDNQI